MPGVTSTSERQCIEASHGLPVRDHRTGDQSVEGTKEVFKRVFFMGRRKKNHATLCDRTLTKPCWAGRKRAGLHAKSLCPCFTGLKETKGSKIRIQLSVSLS